MKRFLLVALAVVTMASAATALELRRYPGTGEMVPVPIRKAPGQGEIVITNYDWVPYTIEIDVPRQRMRVRQGDARRPGGPRRDIRVTLPPGGRVAIPSRQQVWTMEGNNGRRLNIGVTRGRSVDVDLVPDGNNRMIGMEAIVSAGRHRESELLIAWEQRPRHLWPQDPRPTPYPRPPFITPPIGPAHPPPPPPWREPNQPWTHYR